MNPGKIRYKLAELLCRSTGALFLAEDIEQNHPMHVRYGGSCLWYADGLKHEEGRIFNVQAYSWDTMKACVRGGIDLIPDRQHPWREFEVCARSDPK
jgi:hypothetical protein